MSFKRAESKPTGHTTITAAGLEGEATFPVCGAVNVGETVVRCECGLFRASYRPHAFCPELIVPRATRRVGCKVLCSSNGHRGGGPACVNACGRTLECGSSCCRDRGHADECECIGDERGKPGSCPA